MAYRDPAEAARARVRDARERVLRHEERVAPELLEQLTEDDRDELQRAADAVSDHMATELERLDKAALEEALPGLHAYADRLEGAIAAAPRLAKRFNRLPRTYPDPLPAPSFYNFPDMFYPPHLRARKALHQELRRLDPEATIESAKSSYDNQEAKPFVAAARLKLDKARLRLAVASSYAEASSVSRMLFHYRVAVHTRPSTPRLRLTLQDPIDELLKWLRLRKEPAVGDEAFDERFFIRASAEDARLVLRPRVRRSFMELGRPFGFELTVGEGRADLKWAEMDAPGSLEHGLRALAAVRNAPAIALLRRSRARSGAADPVD